MIDLHCHVLPGIDDGPDTTEGSVAMARAAVAAGMRTIVATPHVSTRYRNTAETIGATASALRARLAASRSAGTTLPWGEREITVEDAFTADLSGIDLALCSAPASVSRTLAPRLAEAGVEVELLEGAEVAMTVVDELGAQQLGALRLGDGPWLLLEPPFAPVAGALEGVVASLQRTGAHVLLAHPERCPAIMREPQMLERLVGRGVLASITAGSLTGQFGGGVRAFALKLVEQGLVHNVASDAHDHSNRPPGIAEAVRSAGLGELLRWFSEDVPAALLAGEEQIPASPAGTPRANAPRERRRWLGLRT